MDDGILTMILLVVGTMTVLVSVLCGVNPLWFTFEEIQSRAAENCTVSGDTGARLRVQPGSHTIGQRLSAMIGINITGELYAL
jgi:hypothetical protein